MKLKEYLEKINHHINQNPKILDLEVVYSTDEEGNGYRKVVYESCIIHFENLNTHYLQASDNNENPAICIN